MRKPAGSTVAKQAASARPGFQPSAAAQSTAIEISSGRIGRICKPSAAGDGPDELMKRYHHGPVVTGNRHNAMAFREMPGADSRTSEISYASMVLRIRLRASHLPSQLVFFPH